MGLFHIVQCEIQVLRKYWCSSINHHHIDIVNQLLTNELIDHLYP